MPVHLSPVTAAHALRGSLPAHARPPLHAKFVPDVSCWLYTNCHERAAHRSCAFTGVSAFACHDALARSRPAAYVRYRSTTFFVWTFQTRSDSAWLQRTRCRFLVWFVLRRFRLWCVTFLRVRTLTFGTPRGYSAGLTHRTPPDTNRFLALLPREPLFMVAGFSPAPCFAAGFGVLPPRVLFTLRFARTACRVATWLLPQDHAFAYTAAPTPDMHISRTFAVCHQVARPRAPLVQTFHLPAFFAQHVQTNTVCAAVCLFAFCRSRSRSSGALRVGVNATPRAFFPVAADCHIPAVDILPFRSAPRFPHMRTRLHFTCVPFTLLQLCLISFAHVGWVHAPANATFVGGLSLRTARFLAFAFA